MRMQKRNVKTREFDQIGIALLKASSLGSDEIEQLIGDPNLFTNVKRAIRLQQESELTTAGFRLGIRSIAGVASMAIVIIAVFGLVWLRQLSRQPQVDSVRVQVPAQTENLPPLKGPATKSFDIEPMPASVQSHPARIERAAVRTRIERPIYSNPAKVSAEDAVDIEFYPLPGAAPQEPGEGRVVRVELPRASLVALGANLPLDGGKQTVKTDLLLGQDGVPRAIRLVE